jgi:rhodanese-related sulfurtransferase
MTNISPQELKERLGRNEKPVIIDVREEWEHQEKNLGGQNIPLGQLQDKLDELEQYKEQEVIVHCKSGGRSRAAQAFLQQHGFKNVRNLDGGLGAYMAQDQPA